MTKEEILISLEALADECEKHGERDNDKISYFLCALITFGLASLEKAFKDKSYEIIDKAAKHLLKMVPELGVEKYGEENNIMVNGPKNIQ
ncbi:MAG TPA: hypothetical protein DCY00_06785 [Actinobacteria bacterium]|nr:hypothetical protein [Actinomycetota bacterium]